MLWCDSVAPLGEPVVPEVYWMLTGSSNWSAASRLASSDGSTYSPLESSSSQSSSSTSVSDSAVQLRAHVGEHGHVVGLAEAAREQQQADA